MINIVENDRFSNPPESVFSLVALSYNQIEYTEKFLDSLARDDDAPKFELIVIDNGSSEETKTKLADMVRGLNFPAKAIFNERNLGFAKGCNQGLAQSRGRYLVLVNNDIVVSRSWLRRLAKVFERRPEADLVGPTSNSIAGAALVAVDYKDATYENVRDFAEKRWSEFGVAARESGHLCGFCLAMKREVHDEFGGFDEDYFSGWEDMDFSARVTSAGRRMFIAEGVFVHHFGGVTNKIVTEYTAELDKSQSHRFFRKWFGEKFEGALDKRGIPSPRSILTFKTYAARTLSAAFEHFSASPGAPEIDIVTSRTSQESLEGLYDFRRIIKFGSWDYEFESLALEDRAAFESEEYDLALVLSYSYFGENLGGVRKVLARAKFRNLLVLDQGLGVFDFRF
ncbi:MAG: glycosyltransferase family 2 protein [Planctomycetes bacterium]|nr:glycosyltransferase family 2 protein [Planctomycetota bacterium]